MKYKSERQRRKVMAAVKAQQPNRKGFVRLKKFDKKGYLYHVENEREDGEVVQHHVSYLGKPTKELVKKLNVKVPKRFITD